MAARNLGSEDHRSSAVWDANRSDAIQGHGAHERSAISEVGPESKAKGRLPGLVLTGARAHGFEAGETDPGLPRKDAAIILTVTALIVGLIVLFLLTAPTFASPVEGSLSSPSPSAESFPTNPQETDHAARD